MRTSDTHPLYINWIPVEGDEGKIGITLCPGKYQPVSSTGAWNRDLVTDIAALRTAGTQRLVSLVTEEDKQMLRVPTLPLEVVARGIEWDHLPIPDTTAPTDAWMEAAAPVMQHLLTAIPDGEVVVVHCMGGLSRAGLFVSLYLWMRGMAMPEAIEHVRAMRSPNCINFSQQQFLIRLAENEK